MTTTTPKTGADLAVGDTYYAGVNEWTVREVIKTTEKTVTVLAEITGGFNGWSAGGKRLTRHGKATKLSMVR